MKKIVLLFPLMATALTLCAQPVVNHQFFPRIGHVQSLVSVYPDGITVGTAGGNQNWDFSGLEAIPGAPQTTLEHMSPGLTPFGDAFPEANISGIFTDTIEFFTYYEVTPESWDWIGSGAELGALPFTDPLTILRPMAFDGSFRDTARLSLVYPELEYHQYIEQEVRYRAYGTLKLPQGTFNEVVLIETTQMEIDSFLFPSEGFYSIDTIYTQGYNWMQGGAPGPLCSHSVSNGTSKFVIEGQEPSYSTFGPEYDTRYDRGLVSTVKEPERQPLGIMVLAPNPAEGQCRLSLEAESYFPEASLQLRDATGRLLRSEAIAMQKGFNQYPVVVEGLPAGLYLVSITNGETVQTSRLVVR
ncbi:MAG: T9SS type A sorting domain-containing protein [Phaeodactylibacter sp.]|nr:T9SS type A sorting domain-containing protein [Phaeodactylibacter sp.]MCB9049222.1 T9SS type A sorting domain-containing protein [Lewinellaceae bacterium]